MAISALALSCTLKSSPARSSVVATVGNEDGVHHVSAECHQWLTDVGFTIPATGTSSTLDMVGSNTVHLATLVAASEYQGVPA